MSRLRPDRQAERRRQAKERQAAAEVVDCACGKRHALTWPGCDLRRLS